LVMTGLINWDLFAVALFAVCIMFWMRRRPLWAGVFFGLAVSAKFYPIVVLPAFFVVALRARSLRQFFKFALTSAAVWLLVNVPFIVINVHEWARFYTFSRERGSDFGSVWLASQYLGANTLSIDSLNLWAFIIFAVLGAVILALGLTSPRPPRLAQLAFLLVAAFCVSNKVYSPQYVLWLVPLAAMARPRWREYMVWQISQVVYAMSVWLFLASTEGDGKGQGINAVNYAWIIVITVAVTLWFAALVVRDIMDPDGDIVRTREFDADMSAVESGVTAGAGDAAGATAGEGKDSRSSQASGASSGSDAGAPASDDEDAALSSPAPTSDDHQGFASNS
ncbi:MAG: glycosyltransferase 87 family protein, partial [Actinomycetes bacterium]